MEYFDYDPSSDGESLIVATTESGSAVVKHGKTANWSLPKTFLPADSTVPTGHLLHIALTITLVSGNPEGLGCVVYNDVQGSTTTGLLPQNNGPATWAFAAPGTTSISLACQPDGCVQLDCTGLPGKTYLI